MQLYANPNRPDHAENNAAFLRVVKDFPGLNLFQPSAEKAPWHWQAVIDTGGYPQLLNFWPHVLKGQRDGCFSVQGAEELRGIIEAAIEDSYRPEINLIED